MTWIVASSQSTNFPSRQMRWWLSARAILLLVSGDSPETYRTACGVGSPSDSSLPSEDGGVESRGVDVRPIDSVDGGIPEVLIARKSRLGAGDEEVGAHELAG